MGLALNGSNDGDGEHDKQQEDTANIGTKCICRVKLYGKHGLKMVKIQYA